MALAYSKDIVGRAATWLEYALKAERDQAVQAIQGEFEHSMLQSPHCHPMDDIVQELTKLCNNYFPVTQVTLCNTTRPFSRGSGV